MVAVVKCLNVLATCRNIWYAVSLVADRTSEWIYLSLSLRDRFLFMFMLRNTMGAGRKLVPCSWGELPYPQDGMKDQRLFGNDSTVFQTCVLGLPCKFGNPIRIVRLSRILRLHDPFATQSNKSNVIMINLDVLLKFYHS